MIVNEATFNLAFCYFVPYSHSMQTGAFVVLFFYLFVYLSHTVSV